MKVKKIKDPILKIIMTACFVLLTSFVAPSVLAEDKSLPLQRTIATQAITKLEIISAVKSLLTGRVLSIKKRSSYTNPDCHHVNFLADEGELQVIKLACFTEKLVQKNSNPALSP